MPHKIRELKKCLSCGNTYQKTILDLGKQPLANSYHTGEHLEYFPLKLNVCETCWHLQLSHAVNPDLMFKNYLYVSGTSETLRNYFSEFVEFTLSYNKNVKNVLDIACNDGTQLDFYKKKKIQTYGIDPAENLYSIAASKGHNIVMDYFTKNSVKQFGNLKFDIITAQNVFAHNSYPLEFLKICKNILSDEGHLFIQTSQANMILNQEFDTIYHEHISFFNTLSMSTLVERSGLYLNDVQKTHIHGTSYVFVISKKNNPQPTIYADIQEFTNNKLNDITTYVEYSLNAYKTTHELKRVLGEYKKNNYQLVGYGAAAKGNTLLNFGKIQLDFIVDDNPMKHGLLTPGMNIEIRSPDSLVNLDPMTNVLFIPLAWNFYKEIKNKIKRYRDVSSDRFIKYFPQPAIE